MVFIGRIKFVLFFFNNQTGVTGYNIDLLIHSTSTFWTHHLYNGLRLTYWFSYTFP